MKSEVELEKWVAMVVPPLASAPLSMHHSAIRAMSIRGRYAHHRDAVKSGRFDQLNWLDQEYEHQVRLAQELEEKRLKEEKEEEEKMPGLSSMEQRSKRKR